MTGEFQAALEKLEHRAAKALVEEAETFGKTARGERSKSRKKTKAEVERDLAYAVAYCTAVAALTGEEDHTVVWQRLGGRRA